MPAKKKAAPKAPPAPAPKPPAPSPAIKREEITFGATVVAHMATHGLDADKAWSAVNAGATCGFCKARLK